jgi:hypothetical protein
MPMAEELYTKLTLEVQYSTEQFPEIISIKINDNGLTSEEFIDNLVEPLMVATGYAQQTINDALGRDGDE